MTADEAGTWILEHTPTYFQVRTHFSSGYWMLMHRRQKMMATNYSFGIERDEKILKKNDLDHTKWTNPLEHRWDNVFSVIEASCSLIRAIGYLTHLL